jgi:uncharacterized membrane protein YoaK (UPF0700 family)
MSTPSVATPAGAAETSYVRLRNWLLGGLTVSSGAVDSISFLALGKVFTAFMTGNIAFLGMAIAGGTGANLYGVVPPLVVPVLASMVGFAVGVYLATRIVSASEQPAAREGEHPAAAVWPQRTTVALGVSLLAQLCFVVIWAETGAHPGAGVIPVLLFFWATAMGMQSGAVRRLNVAGIFTTAATATFIFLVGDLTKFRMTADERRRMRVVIISLIIGATAGAYLLIHAPIWAPVLPLVVSTLVVVTAARGFRDRVESRQAAPA